VNNFLCYGNHSFIKLEIGGTKLQTKQKLVSEVISEAASELSTKGYTTHSKSAMMITFRYFQDYANKCGELYYSPELNARFFNDFCAKTSTRRPNQPWTKETIKRKRGALKRLDWIYKYGTIVKRGQQMKAPLPLYFIEILSKFDKWQDKRNYSKKSKKATFRTVSPFIDFIIEHDVGTVEEITAIHVSNYILRLRGHAPTTMKGDLGRLRVFFKFLYNENLTSKNIVEYVPSFQYGSATRESNIWSKDELSKVLNSIDRSSAIGKRDYAACLFAVDLGMRISDIASLKLDDIRWEHPSCIEFTQSKTKYSMTLPLPERVGLAVIDYLKYGRPKTECQKIFVKHISPYDGIERFSAMFYQRVAESGIEKKFRRKYGLHSLRHTIATKMLEGGVEFDKIAPFLGHADFNTLHVYLNSDIEHLRQCALSFETEVVS